MDRKNIFYNWDTSHDQANQTMTHIFVNGVTCIISWAHIRLTLLLRGKVVDVYSFDAGSYTVKDHERTLFRISGIANGKQSLRKCKKALKLLCHELRSM